MPESTFDTLTAARALKDAGIEADHAEAIAAQLRAAAGTDHDALATKTDLAALRTELRIVGALTLAIAAKLFGLFDAVAGVLS